MAVGVARRQTGKDDLLRRKLQMPRQRKRPAGPHRLRAGRQPARDRGEHERLDEHAKIRPLPRSDPAVEAEEESYRRAAAAQVHLLEYRLRSEQPRVGKEGGSTCKST